MASTRPTRLLYPRIAAEVVALPIAAAGYERAQRPASSTHPVANGWLMRVVLCVFQQLLVAFLAPDHKDQGALF